MRRYRTRRAGFLFSVAICAGAACSGASPKQSALVPETASGSTHLSQDKVNAVATLQIPNYAKQQNGLHTAGQPSVEQIRRLPSVGVSHVISLQTKGEAGSQQGESVVRELGLSFERIEVAGAAGITLENARSLQDLLQKSPAEATLVHCASSNRVGALLALVAFLDGAAPEDAVKAGQAAGLSSLEASVREQMARGRN